MEPAWGASWAWGLGLIALTIAGHAVGIALLTRGLNRVGAVVARPGRVLRYPFALTAGLVGVVGWGLAIFHGIEAAIWAGAYRWLGAIGSARDAMLYSVDSITTRGASGLTLDSEWRMLGALEAADGMLLFGISTAYVFAVIQRIERIFGRAKNVRR